MVDKQSLKVGDTLWAIMYRPCPPQDFDPSWADDITLQVHECTYVGPHVVGNGKPPEEWVHVQIYTYTDNGKPAKRPSKWYVHKSMLFYSKEDAANRVAHEDTQQ